MIKSEQLYQNLRDLAEKLNVEVKEKNLKIPGSKGLILIIHY